jgi:hypothetical protein
MKIKSVDLTPLTFRARTINSHFTQYSTIVAKSIYNVLRASYDPFLAAISRGKRKERNEGRRIRERKKKK